MPADELSAFDPVDDVPVTIVFATFNYRRTLASWIEYAARGACDHWRIVCMDAPLQDWLRDNGWAAHAVDYHAVLPDAPRVDYAALRKLRTRAHMHALMAARTRLFLHLAKAGRDFIHSDADAFWYRDPRPWLAAHPAFDLVFSQGTTSPRGQYAVHHFVLCAGFFLCRANARSTAYFERVEALAAVEPLDQARMNRVLLEDRAARWTIDRPETRFRWRWGTPWHRPTPSERMLLLPLRALSAARLLRGVDRLLGSGLKYVLVSDAPIRGQFSDGLAVAIMPMRLASRYGVLTPCRPLVVHPAPSHGGPDGAAPACPKRPTAGQRGTRSP